MVNDNNIKFTVLLLTYNSSLEKLKITLSTILQQKTYFEYEIIVADDGSKDNLFIQLEEYFKVNHFFNYKLVGNRQNAGTVKNILSGLEVTEGTYVKLLSAGDGFYADDTMQKVYDFMEDEKVDFCFGLVRGYKKTGEESVKVVNFCHPFDICAYKKKDKDRIKRNLILYSDNVCGASICYRTKEATRYMDKIKSIVCYEEDIFQVLASVEEKTLCLFDDNMIWYEVGDGISTSGSSKFQALLREDVERFYKKLYKDYPEDKYVKKRYSLMKFYKIENVYLRTICRMIENPHTMIYLGSYFMQKLLSLHQKRDRADAFLLQKKFWRTL